jgi:TPR repeat protein
MGEHTTGWVYVIVNDSIPNKVKVGVTKNHPRLRAKEMNQISAPLPTPYYAATAFLFGDRAYRLEQDTHRLLKKKGVHIEGGAGKEWFECSAIDAAYAIREASTLLNEPIQTEDPVLLTPEEIVARKEAETRIKLEKKINKLRKFAENGLASAQFDLGSRYYLGEGVEASSEEAVRWYRKAAQQGHAASQYSLGECYKAKDDVEAVRWYRKAAQQGHAASQYSLGECYKAKDDVEAFKWYRKAAQQGFVWAQYRLGCCYAQGLGVEKDDAEAAELYHKATEQDHGLAQYRLGTCYANGSGVAKDEVKAEKLFENAAEKGIAAAKAELKRLNRKRR